MEAKVNNLYEPGTMSKNYQDNEHETEAKCWRSDPCKMFTGVISQAWQTKLAD